MKEIVSYVSGSFNDFKGKEHKVVVCGISRKYDLQSDKYSPDFVIYDETGLETWNVVLKTLTIGVAICNPLDEFSLEKGHILSYNRASQDNAVILSTSMPGMFNTETVNCILNNYLNFIKREPGKFILGYNEAQKKHRDKIDLLDDIKKMPQSELDKMIAIANATPTQIEYAKKIVKLLS